MKIGIITMHRVVNYGSALQAFATQWTLKKLGYDSDIIDYEYQKPVKVYSLRGKIIHTIVFVRDYLRGSPRKVKLKRFAAFYSKNYKMTSERYTRVSISLSPPQYDVYMSGSDQVWNPRFAGNDVNFMLAFAPSNKPKISFASSFATYEIDDAHKKLYAPQLKLFNAISVREDSGVEIVKDLTGKDAVVCCDPTLLLTNDVVSDLASCSSLTIGYKYVLVYGLYYMFDPYPNLYNIVNHVCKELKCRAVYLDGRNADLFKRNSKVISSAGPCEFLWLFEHAEFVITTSFHGTAFSLIYNKPFFSVVDKSAKTDSRITSLCRMTKAEKSLIDYRDVPKHDANNLMSLKCDCKALNELREKSLLFLKTNLKNIKV
jgi:hypothetical protein